MSAAKMKVRRFVVTFEVSCEIEVSDAVVTVAMSPEWQERFYRFADASELASHLAFNLLRNGVDDIRRLDGFADRKQGEVVFSEAQWEPIEAEPRP